MDFIEASACTGGCLGGPLTVENLYVAKTRSGRQEESCPPVLKAVTQEEMEHILFEAYPEHRDITTLDNDIMIAMQKLKQMNQIYEQLPALDCGACGSPSCRCLAEDVVRGKANMEDCIFILRQRVRSLAKEMMELEGMMPPVLDKQEQGEERINDSK